MLEPEYIGTKLLQVISDHGRRFELPLTFYLLMTFYLTVIRSIIVTVRGTGGRGVNSINNVVQDVGQMGCAQLSIILQSHLSILGSFLLTSGTMLGSSMQSHCPCILQHFCKKTIL